MPELPGILTLDLNGGIPTHTVVARNAQKGQLVFFNGTTWDNLPAGTTGQVLISQGTGNDPVWNSVTASNTAIFGKTIFVDIGHERATDTRTGLNKYDMNSPFATISAAMAVASVGDTIALYPGTYTLSSTLIVLDGVNIFGYGYSSKIVGKLQFASGSSGIHIKNIFIENTNDYAIESSNSNNIIIESSKITSIYTNNAVNKYTMSISNSEIDIVKCFLELNLNNTSSSNISGIMSVSGSNLCVIHLEGNDISISGNANSEQYRFIFDSNTNVNTEVLASTNHFYFYNTCTLHNTFVYLYYASAYQGVRYFTSNHVEIEYVNSGSNSYVVCFASLDAVSSSKLHISKNIVRWNSTLPDYRIFLGRSKTINDNLKLVENNIIITTDDALGRRYYVQGDLGGFDALNFNDTSRVRFGRAESPKEVEMGEGGFCSECMIVISTNNTATPTTDGGGFIDITENATTDVGTFTFQSTSANSTILIGSNLQTNSGYIKFWGYLFKQVTAAVEITKRSFAFEIWNGTTWVEVNSFSFQLENAYKYANEAFIRSNNNEVVNLGIRLDTTWATKTINGFTGYFSRVRIKNNLTTAPVFNFVRIARSSFIISPKGISYNTGLSRYYDVFLNTSGNWGSSGTLNGSFTVGVGSSPTGWSHQVSSSRLNGDGDFVNANFRIPPGTDTSLPVELEVIFYTSTASSSTATLTVSFLPVEIVGTPEADPSGGIVPIQRSEANTEVVTTNSAQNISQDIDNTPLGYLRKAIFSGFDISKYYEGDMILCRLELTTRNGGIIDLISFSLKIAKSFKGENTTQI